MLISIYIILYIIIRLIDMIQRDATIYLVFEYSDVDLRRYMDKVKRPGLTAGHIKVISIHFFFYFYDLHYLLGVYLELYAPITKRFALLPCSSYIA